MSKAIVFLSLVLFFFSTGYGQHHRFSTVNLLNGSVINGKIIENYPDSLIKIQTEGDNIWVFKYSEIDTVILASNYQIKRSTPFNVSIESGVSVVGGSEFNPAFSLLVSGTYTLKERFHFGITTGAEYFGISLLPVACELKVDFFKRNTTPYIYLRGGYGFSLKPREETESYKAVYEGGLLFGGGIGIKKQFSSDFAMTFSVGYRRQNTFESRDYIVDNWWGSDYERYYFYNRAALMVAFVF